MTVCSLNEIPRLRNLPSFQQVLQGQQGENELQNPWKQPPLDTASPILILQFVLKILLAKIITDTSVMRINKHQQSQRGQSFTSYLFAVFYNWLNHTEVLMTATHGTACAFISCMPLFKRCLSTWQRLLGRWCWRAGQHQCLQCSYFSLKYINLEKKSAQMHTLNTFQDRCCKMLAIW